MSTPLPPLWLSLLTLCYVERNILQEFLLLFTLRWVHSFDIHQSLRSTENLLPMLCHSPSSTKEKGYQVPSLWIYPPCFTQDRTIWLRRETTSKTCLTDRMSPLPLVDCYPPLHAPRGWDLYRSTLQDTTQLRNRVRYLGSSTVLL